MNSRIAVAVLIVSVVAVARAHDEKDMKMMQRNDSPAFKALKSLEGKWQGMSTPMKPGEKPGSVATEFHSTAAGSAVEESLMKGTPHEMVDMYTDAGMGKLEMTHYCAIGNQPHMVLKNATPKMLSFVMIPTPGIDPNSSHMHEVTLQFPDPDHLTEVWTNYNEGKPGETVVFNMNRVK